MKTTFSLLLITLALLLPKVRAVSPLPDGGYPGGSTAEGTDALFSLSNGVWDTALGAQALNHKHDWCSEHRNRFSIPFL